jgi:hypothetical protein
MVARKTSYGDLPSLVGCREVGHREHEPWHARLVEATLEIFICYLNASPSQRDKIEVRSRPGQRGWDSEPRFHPHNGECKTIQTNWRGNLEDQNGENRAFPSLYTMIVASWAEIHISFTECGAIHDDIWRSGYTANTRL